MEKSSGLGCLLPVGRRAGHCTPFAGEQCHLIERSVPAERCADRCRSTRYCAPLGRLWSFVGRRVRERTSDAVTVFVTAWSSWPVSQRNQRLRHL